MWIQETLSISPEGKRRVAMCVSLTSALVDIIGVTGISNALLSLLLSRSCTYTKALWQRRWKDLRPASWRPAQDHILAWRPPHPPIPVWGLLCIPQRS